MSAIFFVYDTVDREVVHASEEWPGHPRSVYRPVYWHGAASTWWVFRATQDGDRSDQERIPDNQVPEAVRLAHMLLT